MSEVIYCGSGKKQNETWIKATINVAKFKDHISEYEGHKFIKLNINLKDEKDQYGKDVSISIDSWEPEESTAQPAAVDLPPATEEDDLPF